MSIIDNAKSHFRDKLNAGLKGPISVPEWDAEIYYKTATTFFQESKVIELQQAGKTTEALVLTLINRALDENGNPVFQLKDKQTIMRQVDPAIVLRIIQEMNDEEYVDGEKLDDIAVKN